MADEGIKEPGAEEKKPDVAADMGSRLSEHDRQGGAGSEPGAGTHVQQEAPIPQEPSRAFDISKMSPEELTSLKHALEGVPSRLERKKGNPIIKLRRIDGRIVTDFKDCFTEIYEDPNTKVRGERIMIPTQFFGDVDENKKPKYTNVVYKDFMNAEQVKCEVTGTRNEEDAYSEGLIESNERPGVMVEMRVTTVRTFFTVKLPEGSPVASVEVEGKIANA